MESFHTVLQLNFYLIIQHFFFSLTKPNQTKPAAIKTKWPLSKLSQQIIFKFCILFQWSTYNKTLWRALQKWLQFCQVIVSLGERNQAWRLIIKQHNSHIIPKFILHTCPKLDIRIIESTTIFYKPPTF